MSLDREALALLRHELRTPLNHIIGYSEMLLEDVVDGDPAALGPGLRSVHEYAQQLLAVINELAHGDARQVDLGRLSDRMAVPLRSVVSIAQALKVQAAEGGTEREARDLERIALAASALESVPLPTTSRTRAAPPDAGYPTGPARRLPTAGVEDRRCDSGRC